MAPNRNMIEIAGTLLNGQWCASAGFPRTDIAKWCAAKSIFAAASSQKLAFRKPVKGDYLVELSFFDRKSKVGFSQTL